MPTVEMPKPTIWPLVLSLGLVLSAMGLALGSWAFFAIGMLLFLVSLGYWLAELLPGRGHEHEEHREAAPQSLLRHEPVEVGPGPDAGQRAEGHERHRCPREVGVTEIAAEADHAVPGDDDE